MIHSHIQITQCITSDEIIQITNHFNHCFLSFSACVVTMSRKKWSMLWKMKRFLSFTATEITAFSPATPTFMPTIFHRHRNWLNICCIWTKTTRNTTRTWNGGTVLDWSDRTDPTARKRMDFVGFVRSFICRSFQKCPTPTCPFCLGGDWAFTERRRISLKTHCAETQTGCSTGSLIALKKNQTMSYGPKHELNLWKTQPRIDLTHVFSENVFCFDHFPDISQFLQGSVSEIGRQK